MQHLELVNWNVLPFTVAFFDIAEIRLKEKRVHGILELVTLYLGVTASVNTCALRRRN